MAWRRRDQLRDSLTGADERRGLWLGVALAAGLGGLALYLLGDTGPSRTVYGTVTGFTLQETEVGSLTMVRVDYQGRQLIVRTPLGRFCRPGHRIVLQERQLRFGRRRYTADPMACAEY